MIKTAQATVEVLNDRDGTVYANTPDGAFILGTLGDDTIRFDLADGMGIRVQYDTEPFANRGYATWLKDYPTVAPDVNFVIGLTDKICAAYPTANRCVIFDIVTTEFQRYDAGLAH